MMSSELAYKQIKREERREEEEGQRTERYLF